MINRPFQSLGILASMIIISAMVATAGEKIVAGKVTYIAAGAVYTSLGRESGVEDSTLLFLTAMKDTLAVLKAFAVSSKSSACRVLTARRHATIGDDVSARVHFPDSTRGESDSAHASKPSPGGRLGEAASRRRVVAADEGPVSVSGRVSAQYFATRFDNAAYNITQPGVVFNVRSALREVPLTLDLYANVRSLSVGSAGAFSKGAVNQSRIYRLSLEYDDGANTATVGRIIPLLAPSVGYVDGAMYTRRFGEFVLGTTVGFHPDYTLRGVTTSYRKFALFGQYNINDPLNATISSAYARTFYTSRLDREVVSGMATASLAQSVFVYLNSEVDLREKSGSDLVLAPALTNIFLTVTYRPWDVFGVGIGVDATRPFYNFSEVRDIPDSLLPRTLRTGASVNFSVYLPGGISMYNNYTPRTSDRPFGKDYSNYGSVSAVNVLATGINARATMNVNANSYTTSNGYGFSLQRTFAGLVDLNLRVQQYTYSVTQLDEKNTSTTLGADLMVFLSNRLTFMMSYDRLRGYGADSHSLFTDVSVRF